MVNHGWTHEGGPLSGGTPYPPPAGSYPPAQAGWPGMPGAHDPGPDPAEQRLRVRPYAITGGRTAPRMALALEALVSSATAPPVDLSMLPPERLAISNLCRQVRSVAEVSALLRMPLGVTRVVIADMAADGQVQIYQQTETERPAVNLL
ncbi:DUF742 domain-containing protein, partial [Sphaerisporangium rufum]|uniref:DUF742 domain-containing protein n=1 Tax=Sphaerisporangium rufum TaxID=1381558 RepID=UPI0027DE532E